MWSRIYLIPLLTAEEDRDLVRRHLADQAREKDLLGTETSAYNSDRYILPPVLFVVIYESCGCGRGRGTLKETESGELRGRGLIYWTDLWGRLSPLRLVRRQNNIRLRKSRYGDGLGLVIWQIVRAKDVVHMKKHNVVEHFQSRFKRKTTSEYRVVLHSYAFQKVDHYPTLGPSIYLRNNTVCSLYFLVDERNTLESSVQSIDITSDLP